MPRTDTKLDQLSKTWLFSNLARKDLRLIGQVTDEISVPAGKVLVEEGKPGREFFFILSGSAVLRRNGRKVTTLGAGQYFGELALLDRLPRSATVISETPMELIVLGQREFFGVIQKVPGLAEKLLAAMASRLREADAKAFH